MSYSVGKIIRDYESFLWDLSQKLWKNPELCFEEKYAHDLLTSTLEQLGFKVERHFLLPTAFRGEFDSGRDGPTIAVICEYDALPKIGHACGHNLIAEIGIAAGMAIKASLENDFAAGGKVIVLGTPAEEGGGGKIRLIEKGGFRNVDAALMAHPQAVDRLFPLIIEHSQLTVKYHAENDAGPWEGPSSVDAAVCCYNNIAVMRRRLSSKWRISVILPQTSWENSEMIITYRAPSRREMNTLLTEIKQCIEAASKATKCTYQLKSEETDGSPHKGMLHNKVLLGIFAKHATTQGIVFRDNDSRFCESAVSSDIGNVSHVVPSIQPEYTIGAHPHVNHTPGFATAAGAPEAQYTTLIIAEALAKTALDLMSNPELLRKAWEEFEQNPARDPIVSPKPVGEI